MPDKKVDSFVQSLCLGRIEEDILFPYPVMRAGEREVLEQVAALQPPGAPHPLG